MNTLFNIQLAKFNKEDIYKQKGLIKNKKYEHKIKHSHLKKLAFWKSNRIIRIQEHLKILMEIQNK